jgi:hypothetical protein
VPTPSLYVREKNPTGVWRYKRVKEGRGVKTGDLAAPFFTRPSVHGKQLWKTLLATTFKEAKEEAAQLTAALDAQAKGLTVAEADALSNTNRIPIRTAVQAPQMSLTLP